jgi:hypothetical protein
VPPVREGLEGQAPAAGRDVGVGDREDLEILTGVGVGEGGLDVDPGLAVGHRVGGLRDQAGAPGRAREDHDSEDGDRRGGTAAREAGRGQTEVGSPVEDDVLVQVDQVVDLAELVVLVAAGADVHQDAAPGKRLGNDRDRVEVRQHVHGQDHRLHLVVAEQVVADASVEVGAAHPGVAGDSGPLDVGEGEQARLRAPGRGRGAQEDDEAEGERAEELTHGEPPAARRRRVGVSGWQARAAARPLGPL